jgi:hypothetical protein
MDDDSPKTLHERNTEETMIHAVLVSPSDISRRALFAWFFFSC